MGMKLSLVQVTQLQPGKTKAETDDNYSCPAIQPGIYFLQANVLT